jgi:hypothetical protein
MRRLGVVHGVVTSLLVLLASACGGGTGSEATTATTATPTTIAKKAATEKDFDRNNFASSTNVDNRWLPLRPGTRLVYEGYINDEGQRLLHRVVFTVTDLTKVIDGVRTVVVYDLDYNAGRLAEAEIAFHAQDRDGNVWNLGEYPEEYEDGKFAGAPDVWVAGLGGAKGGILMRAEPQVGTSSYFQGLAPDIEFADKAKVHKTGQKTCVPADCYDNVLVTDEWDPAEPDAHQFKFYAAGVGNIRVSFGGSKEDEKEILELVRIEQLDPPALAKVRQEALRLDKRAYGSRKGLYRQTPPAG